MLMKRTRNFTSDYCKRKRTKLPIWKSWTLFTLEALEDLPDFPAFEDLVLTGVLSRSWIFGLGSAVGVISRSFLGDLSLDFFSFFLRPFGGFIFFFPLTCSESLHLGVWSESVVRFLLERSPDLGRIRDRRDFLFSFFSESSESLSTDVFLFFSFGVFGDFAFFLSFLPDFLPPSSWAL